MTLAFVIVAGLCFVSGYVAAIVTEPKPMGVLHVDRTHDEKDYWTLEILDLEQVERKSSVTLRVDVKG